MKQQDYTEGMNAEDLKSVIEYMRRGLYEVNRTLQPNHPALKQVLTPTVAKTIISNFESATEKSKSFRYHYCAQTQLQNNNLAFSHGIIVSNFSAEDNDFYEKTVATIANNIGCDAKKVIVLSLSSIT
jgi:hypothetical protein